MKTGIKLFAVLAAVALVLPSCSKLKSGESFNQTINGIEYNFEVIVSRMTFVRLSPVSGADIVRGDIVLPATGEYDGVTYLVTQIREQAFRDYTGITSVKLPAGLSQIEKEAFAGCTSLVSINTPQPLSVIGDRAFDGCVALEAFSLDASISELGEAAFRNCVSLREMEFTPSFSEIPDELCLGCSGIEEITLPSTIMSVGDSAFEGCTGVRAISMDRSVQSLGNRAFFGCAEVQEITCRTATPPSCTEDTFGYIDPEVPVTVPMAQVNDYRQASGWRRFNNIKGVY
ncbi:MAG: leucine-rich repeat domain-containing protein [Bacteroidales bacterium]|nr:leucine-rich repeat domain-containing protein [Bacteroidales bacterium]